MSDVTPKPGSGSRARGARYWLNDMQECCEGEHGEFWQDEFERALDSHIAGNAKGTWQEWRDLRLAYTTVTPPGGQS